MYDTSSHFYRIVSVNSSTHGRRRMRHCRSSQVMGPRFLCITMGDRGKQATSIGNNESNLISHITSQLSSSRLMSTDHPSHPMILLYSLTLRTTQSRDHRTTWYRLHHRSHSRPPSGSGQLHKSRHRMHEDHHCSPHMPSNASTVLRFLISLLIS